MSEEKVNKPRFITGEVVEQIDIVIPEQDKEEKEENENADSRKEI